MNRKLVTLSACAGALVFGVLSCTEDYPPFARLEALRVLAIQSNPVIPGAGETTTLTPLVYTPGGQAVTYAWSWCPLAGAANDGYPCLLPQEQLAALLGPAAQAVPAYDLGTGPTASFTVGFDPALLKPFCRTDQPAGAASDAGAAPDAGAASDAGAAADAGAASDAGAAADAGAPPAIIDCTLGFPVQVRLVVNAAGDEVVSVRTLHLRLDAQAPANTNPQIVGLAATFKLNEDNDETFDVAFDSTNSVMLPRQKATSLKAVVTPEQSEPYTDKDEMGQPLAAKERLFLTWFVESGRTSPERTSFIDGVVLLADASKSKWTPGSMEDYPAATARLFVIIRDNRGGVSWASGLANLVVPE